MKENKLRDPFVYTLIPIYGFYAFCKDYKKMERHREGMFLESLVAEIPLQAASVWITYKIVEYIAQNPVKFLTQDIPWAYKTFCEGASQAARIMGG